MRFLKLLKSLMGSSRVPYRKPRPGLVKKLELEELESRTLMATGLVAAYNFDQGSGSLLADLSGNGNNGTITNATWVNSGKFGGALSFNGSLNSFVTIADAGSLHLTAGMTLEAWVNPKTLNSPDQGWAAAIAKDHKNSNNDISYALYAANGTGTGPGSQVLVSNNDRGTQGNSLLPLNQWTFLAATYDGSTLKMYVNGTLVSKLSISGNITSTTDPLRIGGDWSGEMFTGMVDNVRIYNSALAQTAIQTDMNTTVGNSGATPPVASAGSDVSGNEGSAVTFSGSVTGGSGALSYLWNFGDGTSASGTLTPSHAYADNGVYTATLTVTDGLGRTSQDSAQAIVANVAPTPNSGGPYVGAPGSAVAFSGSATDPSSVDTKAGLSYLWKFGDGATATTATANHAYAAVGTYSVTLTVTDKDGGTNTASTTATVSQGSGNLFPNNLNPPSLPPPSGSIVNVSTVSQLQAAVANLLSGQTILIAAGTYNLTDTLYVPQGVNNISIRGATGNAADVQIWGKGMSGSILYGIWVGNSTGDTFGDFTIGKVADHCFIFNAGVQSPLIHNVTMIDAGEQFVKSNPDGNGGGVNNGIVEYCNIQYTTNAPSYYTNGVDVHTGANWIIRDNVFKNILAVGALAEPAVLFWNGSQNATVEANTFINCQREIAFGLSDPTVITNDNSGGIIRNNFIYRSGGQKGDVAIGVWNSPNSEVANNSIILNGDYVNAVEYRFATTTGVKILYNLTDAAITSRDGATATVTGNVKNAVVSWFVNESIGDLHLTAAATAAINKAVSLPEVGTDYNGTNRPIGTAPDVGAAEFQPGPSVTSVTPANGAINVPTTTTVLIIFSGVVDPSTVNVNTVQLLGPSNSVVSATVTFNTSTETATLTPLSALASNTVYTVLVHGGTSGTVIRDTAGNPLASNFTSSFTTDPPTSNGPAANAGPNKSGNEGTTIQFSGSVTGGAPQLTYAWDFGDGASGSGTLTPTHVYDEAGTYTATLTVTDGLGRTSSSSATVTVNEVTPTAKANGPYVGSPSVAFFFMGSATDSPIDMADGLQYLWTFGDGATSTLQNPTHAYANVGTYQVTFKVTDADGLTASDSTTASVTTAPVPNAGPSQSGNEGTTIQFNGSVTGGAPPLTYTWTYGDGTSGSGTLTPSHVYAEAGTYIATLTVNDGLGRTSSSSTTVTVNEVTPTANAGGPYSGYTGTAINFIGAATDSPADLAAGIQYAWNFGDGSSSTQQNPSHAYAAVGTYQVTLTVTDVDGLTASATTSATVTSGGSTNEPLVYQSNVKYIGAFRVPAVNDPLQPGVNTYDYGGTALAYNPVTNSLFIVGMPYDNAISELSIPSSIVNSSNIDALATAKVLQAPMQVLAKLPSDPLKSIPNGEDIGGLIVSNGQLIGTDYAFYDAAGSAVVSHFVLSSLSLSTASVKGLYQVGNLGGGYVAGYMTPIPSEWQSSLGATYLTGQADINIVSRTSSGPAAFGFNPSDLGSGVAPITPYVYYPSNTPLGPYEGPADPLQSGTSHVNGAVFVPGSRTVLFFGSTGTNYDGYGEASTYGDSNNTSKGPHSLNGEYSLQVWAYDANSFLAAKQGTLRPWEVQPYDVWNFTLPIPANQVGGVAFDAATGRLYVSVLNADTEKAFSSLPLIEVFQLSMNLSGGPAAPQIGTLAATPSNLAQGAITAGTAVTLTAGNVYDINPSGSVSKVTFYLDTNNDGILESGTDKLLGNGTQSTIPNASHNWTTTISTSGMSSGTYTIFAQVQDSDGLFSNPIATTFTIK